MTITHSQKEPFIGDEWQIHGVIRDRAGIRLNLSGVMIEWSLYDIAGTQVITPDDVTITIAPNQTTNPGECTIVVPSTITDTIGPGRYSDKCRISSISIPKETVWEGPIIAKRSVKP